jgi:hypothetical protein
MARYKEKEEDEVSQSLSRVHSDLTSPTRLYFIKVPPSLISAIDWGPGIYHVGLRRHFNSRLLQEDLGDLVTLDKVNSRKSYITSQWSLWIFCLV